MDPGKMQFRRNAACDQRRRRVLLEENLLETDLDEATTFPSGNRTKPVTADRGLKAYADAALADRQPPVTAVIPRRRWTLAVLALSGLAAITGLEALYGNLQLSQRNMLATELGAFDVQGRGGLAAWLSSLVLALAAFQGIQIYRIRRHKTNDYRGRYRLWLWVPVALFFMAMCVATHIHHDLANLACSVFAIVAPVDETLFWPVAYGVVWTLASLRLAFEVRESRASLASLFLATCCYFATAIMVVVPDVFLDRIVYVMVTTTIAMLGHLTTFFTVAVYGRHVYLDSQGMIPVRMKSQERQKPRKQKAVRRQANDDEEGDVATYSDRSKGRSSKGIVQTRATGDSSPEARSPSATSRDRSERVPDVIALSEIQPQILENEPAETRKLSKSERRRLRKQKRREQMRRAA
jgi:hypothetical protein